MPKGVYKRKPFSDKHIKNMGLWRLDGNKQKKWSEKQSKIKKDNPVNYWLGKKRSKETAEKIKNALTGRKISEEHRNKIIQTTPRGERHYLFIKDRTKLVKKQERNDTAYKEWRKQVWLRDGWKCKISNTDCKGRIEAHHILGWTAHPELRYQINNGITLCHAHHPRKRAEEKRLSPYFQELVSVSKD